MKKQIVVKNEPPKDCLSSISAIMSNPDFKSFFESFCSNWSDTKAVLMLMHAYHSIEESVNEQKEDGVASPEEITAVLRKMMLNSEYRAAISNVFSNFMDEQSITFKKSIRDIYATELMIAYREDREERKERKERKDREDRNDHT